MILWYYLDQMPVSEIAEIVDKSENATRVTIFRAMEELRKLFPQDTSTSQKL
jgi:DNA-directed RNA polymerase specialized sigma24 family protein